MKYISLFSGIGGFEVAIHKVFPDAECIGYSEIKPHALKVYQHHYPKHKNLGDITKITDRQIRDLVRKNGCDLVVGGFPCTNLSSIANIRGSNLGLKGKMSGLFYDLIRVLKILRPKKIIIENNASMSKVNKIKITRELKPLFDELYTTVIDAANFSVQTRKRIFWTNFPIFEQKDKCEQSWEDILEPLGSIDRKYFLSNIFVINTMNKVLNRRSGKGRLVVAEPRDRGMWEFVIRQGELKQVTRFQLSMHSDTGGSEIPYTYPIGKSRPLCAGGGGGFSHGILIDRRSGQHKCFYIRSLTPIEKCRLFGFSDDYVDILTSRKAKANVLGNSISVYVLQYILLFM